MSFNRFEFISEIFKDRLQDFSYHLNQGIQAFGQMSRLQISWRGQTESWKSETKVDSSREIELAFQLAWGEESIQFAIEIVQSNDFFKKDKSLIESYTRQICYGYFLQAENAYLETHVYQDDLTGVYNYRKLHCDIERSVENFNKNKKPFSLVFIDIDHFKQVNDSYGHRTGSFLIQELSKHLVSMVGEQVSVYRYGGDEFVFLCQNYQMNELTELLQKLLGHLKTVSFELPSGKKYQMSLSMGVAEFPTHAKSVQQLIDLADKMMYSAKKQNNGSQVLFPGHKKFAA